jgi:mono/diheme cytochrome c family protein
MADNDATNPTDPPGQIAALVAQFAGPEELLEAASQVRDAGYRRWDTHTPYPIHGMDHAMGIRPTLLPWLVLGGGIAGAAVALLLQWWTNAVDYPIVVSGKPLFSLPAFIPVTFELIILFAALTAFVGVLVLNQLPQFWHPAFLSRRFVRATSDGFFLSIDVQDKQFDEQATTRLLEGAGAVAIDVCHEPTTGREIPAGLYWAVATLAVLAILPPVAIAWYRSGTKQLPRVHLVSDMDSQPKYKAQATSPLFADGRASRLPVPGTVAVGEREVNPALDEGKVGDQWVDAFPVRVDMQTIERGRERFNIYCAPCHGLTGDGDGMVAVRAAARAEANWVPPLSLHVDSVRQQPLGQIYHTITNGIRTMPAYGSQITVEDRWAIVLYVKALQRSQHATLEDVPEAMRGKLR